MYTPEHIIVEQCREEVFTSLQAEIINERREQRSGLAQCLTPMTYFLQLCLLRTFVTTCQRNVTTGDQSINTGAHSGYFRFKLEHYLLPFNVFKTNIIIPASFSLGSTFITSRVTFKHENCFLGENP